MARPGDFKMSITYLEMGGYVSWIDPGVWGALLITKEQADELDATMATVTDSPNQESSDLEMQEWRKARVEFRRAMSDTLTPDQLEVRLKKLLAPQQFENYRSTSGSSPTGAATWTQ